MWKSLRWLLQNNHVNIKGWIAMICYKEITKVNWSCHISCKKCANAIHIYFLVSELFNVFHDAYLVISFGGRDRILKKVVTHIKERYSSWYLLLHSPVGGIKKIAFKTYCETYGFYCWQVDLIGFQTQPDRELVCEFLFLISTRDKVIKVIC